MTKAYLASLACCFAAGSFIGSIVSLVPDNDWNRGLVYAVIASVFLSASNMFSYAYGKQEANK